MPSYLRCVRKAAILIMMFVYGLLSIGIQLHLHYCCGKISTSEFFESKKCCGQSEKEHDCSVTHNCCRFEDVSFKIDESHTASTFKLPTLKTEIQLSLFLPELPLESDHTDQCETINQGAPPGKVPIYIAQHSLVFYA